MKQRSLSRLAFTMVELLVVIIIISVIASFGAPSFSKMINKAKARDAINNLTVIAASQQLYMSRYGVYDADNSLPGINGSLGVSLVQNDANYDCSLSGGTECQATNVSGGASAFQVKVTLANPIVTGGVNPSCTGTACPF